MEPEHQTPTARPLANGRGWAISDVSCAAGPHDVPFEEQHSRTSIAVVLSGSFQYRSSTGNELMTPGSLLLGNAGECFCCSHEHGAGDRCVAFTYDAEYWEELLAGAGLRCHRFRVPRIPPVRASAPLVVDCLALQSGHEKMAGDELSVELAAAAAQWAEGVSPASSTVAPAALLSRVSRVVRMIDNEPGLPQTLDGLARCAGLSPYHFLRVFQTVTGSTPHQYLLRFRLRKAAFQLRAESTKVLDVALDNGFGDVSNFNRAFRSEFGMSPRAFRSRSGTGSAR